MGNVKALVCLVGVLGLLGASFIAQVEARRLTGRGKRFIKPRSSVFRRGNSKILKLLLPKTRFIREMGKRQALAMSIDGGFLRRSRQRRQLAYCDSRRDPISKLKLPCCLGRDDDCSLPFYDTTCYCDEFCLRSRDADCCPDYVEYCFEVGFGTTTRPSTTTTYTTSIMSTLTPSPSTADTKTTTSISTAFTTTRLDFGEEVCYNKGTGYTLGERIRRNCNECICQRVLNGYYNFVCEENECLVHPNLIEVINQGEYGWQASNYTFFWGLTLNDGFRYRLGTKRAPVAVREMSEISVHFNEVLPEIFDSRIIWPDYILPPRDQGNCASSWAFSTTSVASDRLAIQSNGLLIINLSPQHLISCHSYLTKQRCMPERTDRAWWFLRRRGVVSSECYPYTSGRTDTVGQCQVSSYSESTCPSGSKVNKKFKTSPPYRISHNERDIMKEIRDNGPVQATMRVTRDFFLYKSGIYDPLPFSLSKSSGLEEGDYHSVKIVGWGIETSALGVPVKYWTVQNSWGNEWGEGGYFRIARGLNASEIENMIVAVWAKLD